MYCLIVGVFLLLDHSRAERETLKSKSGMLLCELLFVLVCILLVYLSWSVDHEH